MTITRTIPLTAIPNNLGALVEGMTTGEEIILTKEGEPVAVVKRTERKTWPSIAGTAKDRVLSMSPDFDAPLDDFAEYMA